MNIRVWPTRPRWMVDAALTVVMAGLGLVEVASESGLAVLGFPRPYDGWLVLAVLVQTAPLLRRRQAPIVGLAVNCVVLWITHGAGYRPMQIDPVVLLLFFYAAGAFQARRAWVMVAAAVAAPIEAFVQNYPESNTPLNTVGLSVVFTAGYLMGRAVDRYRQEADAQRDRAQQVEADRERRIQQAVADERTHIARELHDVVAHSLGFIALEAEAGRAVFDRDPKRAREALETVGTAGRQGLSEMRRLLAMLREHDPITDGTPQAPQPTLADLPALADSVRAAGLPVELTLDVGRHAALPAGLQLSAYRIVQEALTNALKYAGNATAHVAVRHLGEQLSVEVVDTGNPTTVGYPRPRDNDGHVPHGLIGMRERVALYGGELQAGPLPGSGWRVAAVLALDVTAPEEVPA